MLDVNCVSQNEATLLFPLCILSDCCPTLIITAEFLSHTTNFYDLQVTLGVKNLIKNVMWNKTSAELNRERSHYATENHLVNRHETQWTQS